MQNRMDSIVCVLYETKTVLCRACRYFTIFFKTLAATILFIYVLLFIYVGLHLTKETPSTRAPKMRWRARNRLLLSLQHKVPVQIHQHPDR